METSAWRKMALNIAVIAIVMIAIMAVFARIGYWQGLLYGAVLSAMMAFVVAYFLKYDSEFLRRRMQYHEKEPEQKRIISAGMKIFTAAIVIVALDVYFSWTAVPVWVVFAADAATVIGYLVVFLAFRENHYASRIIEVVPGQKLIFSGPYAVVRHPMYVGNILMSLMLPVALGSLAGFPVMMLYVYVIYRRIINEEEVLRRDLAGYVEYCKKVKFRLVPGIW